MIIGMRGPHPPQSKQQELQQQQEEQQQQQQRETRQERFTRMVSRMNAYRQVHGHTLVTKQDDEELHVWAQSIRKNYHPPHKQILEVVGAAKSKTTTNTSSSPIHRHARRRCRSSSSSCRIRQVPSKKLLPLAKRQQLQDIGFVWDVQEALWDRKYRELEQFVDKHGHCFVPLRHHQELGVWVRNQRREYRKLERGESSTLLQHCRLQKLQALSFAFSRSHAKSWEVQYQALVDYVQLHGHADVPEHSDEPPYVSSLGRWCMNQRTAYRRRVQGLPTGLTQDKIERLNQVKFTWNIRETRWYAKLQQVKDYYERKGHVYISPHDDQHRELRVWLSFQRYYYNLRRRLLKKRTRIRNQQVVEQGTFGTVANPGNQERQTADTTTTTMTPSASSNIRCPLTEERIQALEEAIPNFSWKLRGGTNGPSIEDWNDLFQAVQEKGIRPGMRPKQHWFEGQDRFAGGVTFKDVWTEQDLLELWNQESDDDDTDDDVDEVGDVGDGEDTTTSSEPLRTR